MKRLWLFTAVLCLLCAAVVTAQTPPLTAEAIGEANLRSAPGTDWEIVGSIRVGTRYPVIARSALYPWLLLGNPGTPAQPIGWVFRDLVTTEGDVNGASVSESPIDAIIPTPTASATLGSVSTLLPGVTPPAPTATPTAPLGSVTGTTSGEINIRYAPGVEYARVGVGAPGERFVIAGTHTQFPWVQIVYPGSPNGYGWVNVDLLQITGDLTVLPAISQTSFNFPTLTPTPSPVEALPVNGVPVSPAFRALGDSIFTRMLEKGFDPATSRLGSFYLKDLTTGETMTLGDEFAFSGMSVNKIAVLVTLYSVLANPPDDATAQTIAEALICSENISTNELLALIGGGNPWTGAERVSAFLEQIGLGSTFVYTPFANDPFITPQPARSRVTDVNQVAAQPDAFNQATLGDLGALLDAVYQCGYGDAAASILLTRTSPDTFTPDECRHILNIMSYNRIGNFIESGTPADVRVAHKHGWIEDSHGDAAVVFSPGGAYIIAFILHNPVWLAFEDSESVIEESARAVYNYFNPDAPLAAVRDPDVPATCNLLGNPAIVDMQRISFP
ncbi:MAG: serine hydrolase [Chloroflexota bacterium]|nr:serine hydrolase [Chloroflexota bacterium]